MPKANHIIIGSYLYKDLLQREPNDIDILTIDPETDIYDFGLKKERLVDPDLFDILLPYTEASEVEGYRMLDHNVYYTLKLSHLPHDLNNGSWGKHMKDCLTMYPKCFHEESLLKTLIKYWNDKYGDKYRICLDKTPEEFFVADYNQRHDWLHEQFKLTDEPIFKKFLKEGHEVLTDKNKFNALTFPEKLYSVVEECMVISFERSLSLNMGLKMLITKLSKGYWNTFILENLGTVLEEIKLHKQFYKQTMENIKCHLLMNKL